MTTPSNATGRRPNWGVALVTLLGVNVVADLVLGRRGITGVEAAVLVVLWAAWWVLVVVAVVSAVRRGAVRR